ncbi:MAG: deoxyribodipyrimidine photo-lyase [Gammaproteobacteria bacterium]|nr:deoxyribodipyrimidine photo-lyase [Gammaproteobacteria bacterium]
MRALVWFRRDLRLADNPAVHAASKAEILLPVYIHAPAEAGAWPIDSTVGAAAAWGLHEALQALANELQTRQQQLHIAQGNSLEQLLLFIAQANITHVFWNRQYEPWAITRDKQLKQALRERGIICESFNASLLLEPWNITTREQKPYQVFTPFWKTAQSLLQINAELKAPSTLPPAPRLETKINLATLALKPAIGWDKAFYSHWVLTEKQAQQRLRSFARHEVAEYDTQRDQPAVDGTSALSPYLQLGIISPRQIWRGIEKVRADVAVSQRSALDIYLKELGWREFAYHLLFHFPDTPETALRPAFRRFKWRDLNSVAAQKDLGAWQQGQTGIPIIDAGMRQLWQTGWMHNRVRMLVASFLTKNLRLPWQVGAQWFWDTLLDADLASNTLGWQWSAGCGADAAPYFRIFNPVLQSQKFDSQGEYLLRWLPELSGLAKIATSRKTGGKAEWLHAPWLAPATVLQQAGILLGETYPAPIVDLQQSRVAALAAYQHLKDD